jgi:ATP-dependent DNA helicase RecQ
MGFIRQTAEKFTTLELTAEGFTALKERRPITLTKRSETRVKTPRKKVGAIACDEALFNRLRQLRRKFADERAVPAYLIFSDATLRHLAARTPSTPHEFGNVPGVGEQKLRDFSAAFLAEIASWRENTEPRILETPNSATPTSARH